MRKVRKRSIVYNAETGEEYFRQDFSIPALIMETRNKYFSKLLQCREVKLKDADLGKWHKLLHYLERNTNRLVEREIDAATGWLESRPLRKRDLLKILHTSEASFYRFMNNCHEMGYIREGAMGDFYVSPLYALNGTGFSVELYLIFRDVKEFNDALTKKDKAMISAYLGIDVDSNIEQNN